MKTSKVHVSLAIQYASDAIGKIAELVDRSEIDEDALKEKIFVAKTALDRALSSLDRVPMSSDEEE
ncbi:hypothetical protein LCGC14_1182330 [marine sediment metagenome]|uniref:Uncharacterized protein n=1 Tax=marine sediment metagenome TaxID=412755 RepID=A0A0F9LLT2_9ZZZZ